MDAAFFLLCYLGIFAALMLVVQAGSNQAKRKAVAPGAQAWEAWEREAERLINAYAGAASGYGMNQRWAEIQSHLRRHPASPSPTVPCGVPAKHGESFPQQVPDGPPAP